MNSSVDNAFSSDSNVSNGKLKRTINDVKMTTNNIINNNNSIEANNGKIVSKNHKDNDVNKLNSDHSILGRKNLIIIVSINPKSLVRTITNI